VYVCVCVCVCVCIYVCVCVWCVCLFVTLNTHPSRHRLHHQRKAKFLIRFFQSKNSLRIFHCHFHFHDIWHDSCPKVYFPLPLSLPPIGWLHVYELFVVVCCDNASVICCRHACARFCIFGSGMIASACMRTVPS
jgi:hypothetical protein